jgi:hypothetical protein
LHFLFFLSSLSVSLHRPDLDGFPLSLWFFLLFPLYVAGERCIFLLPEHLFFLIKKLSGNFLEQNGLPYVFTLMVPLT